MRHIEPHRNTANKVAFGTGEDSDQPKLSPGLTGVFADSLKKA